MLQTPVHILAGFLGTGKTTALKAELARRQERCAVIVNDFGEAQIDRTLLGGAVPVTDIAGGCLCCTAPANLVPALTEILETIRPDRIFIEPSGLARPQDIVDMLARSGLKERVQLRPTIVLVDPSRLSATEPLLEAQLEAADIVVANRCDLATAEELEAFDAKMAAHWPAFLRVVKTTQGQLPTDIWDWPEGMGLRLSAPKQDSLPSTTGFLARSCVLPAALSLRWDALRQLLLETAHLERFKGLLHLDTGWLRVDYAGGRLHISSSAHRSDSRADVILKEPGDVDSFIASLLACTETGPLSLGPEISLVDADGYALRLNREALLALPGQITDVSARVPGRVGSAVLLREVLALSTGSRYLVSAGDGMTTEPMPISGVGEALLLHSLEEGPLPTSQGGPFRLLVPKGGSNCSNVKGVVRIRLLEDYRMDTSSNV
jgi:G3E family GTPase